MLNKRRSSPAEDERGNQKRLKLESLPTRDRKKRRRRKRKVAVTAPSRVPVFHSHNPKNTESNASSDLVEELQEKTLLLQKHQQLFDQIQQSLTCQICLDLLHKPYVLAPCGHVACHSCLLQWFTSPGPHDPPPNFYTRKKTCPHCRAVVREAPVEVWDIKTMVSLLVKSDIIPGSSEQRVVPEDTSDPWKNVFRKPFSVDQNPHDNVAVEDIGMFDPEDRVHRCLDCMHEIWPDGHCSGCQRHYPAHLPSVADVLDILDGNEYSDVEFEEGSENSFIDDGSDDGIFPIFALSQWSGEYEEESDDDDAASVSTYSPEVVEVLQHTLDISDSDENEDFDEPAYRSRRHRNSALIIDDEDESEGEENE